MAEARLSVRTDAALKEQAQALYGRMGMDLSTAINVFLRQSILEQGMPFRPYAESPAAIEARRQAESGEGVRYASVDELMASLNA